MRRVCAWCGRELDGHSPLAGEGYPVTHGICETCVRNQHSDGMRPKAYRPIHPPSTVRIVPCTQSEAGEQR